ncbi:TPA: tRNA 5-methoxyuridine(34)/uridine 5-oxyacetic acid(34) synthase CmoB [Proteus mirabilis]
MINFSSFYQHIAQDERLFHWLDTLPAQLSEWRAHALHGHFASWERMLENLPEITPTELNLKQGVIANKTPALSTGEQLGLTNILKALMPWRKGPFSLYGVNIDTEWRSDWKWDRVLPHLSPLKGRLVLDVGCGSGYHMWRMLGEGADFVVGIDPTQLFLCQFEAVRKLLGNDQRAHLIPVGIEQMPELNAFDTVFSMGVLYHRRSPLDHLWQLKNQLVSGGELVLESLVIDGDEFQCLIPGERYAQMRNVYFIPSANMLKVWLEKCGFKDVRIVDENVTSLEEQRKTDWMVTDSLEAFLDPLDHTKTVEGYPAPKRAILIATKP